MEVEIGIGKSGRRAYGLDDIAIVPSRRTRDPGDVDISWELDAFRFELPVIAAAMDGVVSPRVAIDVGELGGLACLNLEGLWTRYEDPEPLFEEIAELSVEKATRRMQEIYAEPIKGELIEARIREIKDAGVTSSASLTPQRVERYAKHVLKAELDILVIQGTVVSAEHVSKTTEPLNLKKFIREFEIPVVVGGCASYSTALHLMRTGAVGVLVGVGPGHACTTRGVLGIGVPQATAIADAVGRAYPPPRRDRRLRARHRRRRDAHGWRHRQGDRVRRRLRDDRFAARGRVRSARAAATTGAWPRSMPTCRVARACKPASAAPSPRSSPGPRTTTTARMNLFGALRTSMATTGYETLKEFQKAEVMVAPSLQTEGKALQRAQGVGMGR